MGALGLQRPLSDLRLPLLPPAQQWTRCEGGVAARGERSWPLMDRTRHKHAHAILLRLLNAAIASGSALSFFHAAICLNIWPSTLRASRFSGRSWALTPSRSPASLMKYSRSSSLHLLVRWARRTFSEANCSSRSKRSSAGGGGSRREGGKTAGCSGGRGCSNCGGIRESGSCLTSSFVYRSTASGMREVSNLKSWSSKREVKSLLTSSVSYAHRAAMPAERRS